ncbi:MAG: hypothetical protein FWF53_05695 [Candidatus Azobacteroides sp.]|nr:hypothetical protein [Candidatus Azobacteroides sp.]
MKERLIEFLAYLGMGQTKFEEKVGLSRGFVNKIGEGITGKTLKKINEVYPELNTNWLKTGEGDMIRNNQSVKNVSGEGIVGNNVNGGGINDSSVIGGLMDTIKKKDEQVDRLLSIIEKLSNK